MPVTSPRQDTGKTATSPTSPCLVADFPISPRDKSATFSSSNVYLWWWCCCCCWWWWWWVGFKIRRNNLTYAQKPGSLVYRIKPRKKLTKAKIKTATDQKSEIGPWNSLVDSSPRWKGLCFVEDVSLKPGMTETRSDGWGKNGPRSATDARQRRRWLKIVSGYCWRLPCYCVLDRRAWLSSLVSPST